MKFLTRLAFVVLGLAALALGPASMLSACSTIKAWQTIDR